MEKDNRLWKLLGKLTSGEASDKERKELDGLLEEKDGNIKYMMSVLEHYWESVECLTEKPGSSTGHTKSSQGSLRKTAEKYPVKSGRIFSFRKRRVQLWAAILILFLTGGWFAWHTLVLPASEMNVVSTRSGSKSKVTLPDGTQVWLNADSKLSYPNDFQHTNRREVVLSGEAYFDVKHEADRPFIIHTKYLDITDIGTSFNVKAYPDDNETEAALVSGSIKVSLHKNPEKSFILKPAEKIVYYASGDGFSLKGEQPKTKAYAANSISKIPVNTSIKISRIKNILGPSGDSIVAETAWIKNQLVFDGQSFSDLTKRMGRWYNVQFEITDKAIANYKFTGVFDGETLEQAMEELQMIRPFQYTITKDLVVISN